MSKGWSKYLLLAVLVAAGGATSKLLAQCAKCVGTSCQWGPFVNAYSNCEDLFLICIQYEPACGEGEELAAVVFGADGMIGRASPILDAAAEWGEAEYVGVRVARTCSGGIAAGLYSLEAQFSLRQVMKRVLL